MDKSFELIYRQMEGMYAWLIDRLPARQDSLFKTYLWSGSLAFTVNAALLAKATPNLFPAWWSMAAILAAAIALLAIILCLNSMRGRASDNVAHPTCTAYLSGLLEKTYTPEEAMRYMIGQMEASINHQAAAQSLRAGKLRAISMLLIASFLLLFLAYCLNLIGA